MSETKRFTHVKGRQLTHVTSSRQLMPRQTKNSRSRLEASSQTTPSLLRHREVATSPIRMAENNEFENDKRVELRLHCYTTERRKTTRTESSSRPNIRASQDNHHQGWLARKENLSTSRPRDVLESQGRPEHQQRRVHRQERSFTCPSWTLSDLSAAAVSHASAGRKDGSPSSSHSLQETSRTLQKRVYPVKKSYRARRRSRNAPTSKHTTHSTPCTWISRATKEDNS